jgi:hypothetical protein
MPIGRTIPRMQTALSSAVPGVAQNPPAPRARPWARWFAPREPQAVTALMLGERCLLARVQANGKGGRLELAAVAEGGPDELRRWKTQKYFDRSQAVLVLHHHERHLLTMDRPEVPDAELAMAVRFPLAEAMELEPDELLCTALALPRINPALHAQVLAVAGRVAPTRTQLALLGDAGITLKSIDTIDTALRGMSLLQRSLPDADPRAQNDGSVVLAFVGNDICIGLLWRGEFCALRTLALPVRAPRDTVEFEEHLALHIQRTTDHFERQATQLSVRQVLASMPALEPSTRDSLRAALSLPAQLFELDAVLEMNAVTREHVSGDNDLTALACVAAARLIDRQAAASAAHTPATEVSAPEAVS